MRVELYATLRMLTKESGIEVEPKRNVRDLLALLGERFGSEFVDGLLSEDGGLQVGVIVLVNGVNVLSLQGLDTRLQPQDTVAIFPPLGGG